MRTLIADTKIRIKAPRRELTGETKVKLGQIKDLSIWRQLNKLVDDARKKPKHKPAGSPGGTGGQFAREYDGDYESVKKGLEDKYNQIQNELTPAEKEAIKEYTEESSEFNKYVRGEKLDPQTAAQIKPKVEALDKALSRTTVGNNVQVYRTLSVSSEEINKIIPLRNIDINTIPKGSRNLFINKYLEGEKIVSQQDGYISTTINPNYQMTKAVEGKPFISYTIKVPHEANGLYVKDLSKIPHQEELLVLRGYSLDLKSIKYDANRDRYKIEAELQLEET